MTLTLPSWVSELHRCVVLAPQIDSAEDLQVPQLLFRLVPGLLHFPEASILKTSLRLPYPGTPYRVTIETTRRWSCTKTQLPPATACSISLTGPEWDDYMSNNGDDLAVWEQDGSLAAGSVFSESSTDSKARFMGFLDCVLRVREILNTFNN